MHLLSIALYMHKPWNGGLLKHRITKSNASKPQRDGHTHAPELSLSLAQSLSSSTAAVLTARRTFSAYASTSLWGEGGGHGWGEGGDMGEGEGEAGGGL